MSTADRPNQQHDDLKDRIYSIEQTIAAIAQILHVLHGGDVRLNGATVRLLEKIDTMPGGRGIKKVID